jgi:hypothetical protein
MFDLEGAIHLRVLRPRPSILMAISLDIGACCLPPPNCPDCHLSDGHVIDSPGRSPLDWPPTKPKLAIGFYARAHMRSGHANGTCRE